MVDRELQALCKRLREVARKFYESDSRVDRDIAVGILMGAKVLEFKLEDMQEAANGQQRLSDGGSR